MRFIATMILLSFLFILGCSINRPHNNLNVLRTRIIIENNPNGYQLPPANILMSMCYTSTLFRNLNIEFKILEITTLQENKSIDFYKKIDSVKHNDTMNIYFVSQPITKENNLAGLSSFPWVGEDSGNFIIIRSDYCTGHTLSHEIGHYFGLLHTFDKDMVDDTLSREEFSAMYDTGGINIYDLYDNIMNYHIDVTDSVTEGQLKRMRYFIGKRSNVFENQER